MPLPDHSGSVRPQFPGVSTATQLGYAAGLLFVLPIGDGHLAESRTPRQVNGLFLGLVLLAFTTVSLNGANTLWVLGAAVVLLDAGIQGNQIANQTRIYSLPPALHSRINLIYMVIYFLGGALGSLNWSAGLGNSRMVRSLLDGNYLYRCRARCPFS
jgi:hypothetical protein